MNRDEEMDRTLRSWLDGDAAPTAPAPLLDLVVDSTRRRRQQPRWLARLPGVRAGATARVGGISGGVLVFVVLIAGLAAAALLGGILTGGSPPPATPSTFAVAAPACPEVGPQAPAPGTLPQVGGRTNSRPRNGLLAVTDFDAGEVSILDPASGKRLATWAGAGTSADGWSPDGRWLWLRAPAVQPDTDRCTDLFIASSDGTRVLPVSQSGRGDAAWEASWSPDGRWLATAMYHSDSQGFTGRAIDVVRIGDDGAVLERRRVWPGVATPPAGGAGGASTPGDVTWGPDGTLAWQADGGVYLLRPGQTEPVHFVVDDTLFPMRWSADSGPIVALKGGGLRVISVDEAASHVLDLPIRPLTGMDMVEDTVAISSEGRIFFPAGTDIFSVALDGTDVRNVSASPTSSAGTEATGPSLSPDESQLAFRRGDVTGGVWVMATDGSGLRSLPAVGGTLSWQPVP